MGRRVELVMKCQRWDQIVRSWKRYLKIFGRSSVRCRRYSRQVGPHSCGPVVAAKTKNRYGLQIPRDMVWVNRFVKLVCVCVCVCVCVNTSRVIRCVVSVLTLTKLHSLWWQVSRQVFEENGEGYFRFRPISYLHWSCFCTFIVRAISVRLVLIGLRLNSCVLNCNSLKFMQKFSPF
jgi:hypothetical protein